MSDPGDGEEVGASVPSVPPGSEAETRDDDGTASNDVDRSGAMRVLRELHNANVVSDEQFDFLSSKYATLHSSLLETMENDRRLLSKARTLNKRLTDDRNRLEALSNHGDAASHIELLREDVEHAEQEAAVCSEREQLSQVEVSELTSQREDMRALIEDAHAQYSVELEPQVRQLRDDIATLRDENSETAKRRTNTENECNNVLEKDRETSRAIEAIKDAKRESEADYARATVLPEKIRKQAEAVAISQNALRTQEMRIQERFHDTDVLNHATSSRLKELGDQHSAGAAQLERAKLLTETKERQVEELRKEVEAKALEVDQAMADQINIDIQLKHNASMLRHENDELAARLKEKEQALRRHRKVELQVRQVRDNLPTLLAVKNEAAYTIHTIEGERRRLAQQLAELTREKDNYMNSYMKEDEVSKEKKAAYEATNAEIRDLEREVVACKKALQAREHQVSELSSQRERASRQAAIWVRKLRETKEQIRVKDLIVLDLKKKQKETTRRLSDFSQLYHMVKNQRNKFVNLIQASSQNIAEMMEKLKILGNETEILRNEVASKDKLLAKARHDLQTGQVDRDHLRAELNKCALVYKEKQDAVDEQVSEIDKLNAVINGCERDMLQLKKNYEMCIESRNHTGVMLIDRNDELCILYEKSNIMEQVQRNGEVKLNQLTEHLRVVQLDIREMHRRIDVTRKQTPNVPRLDQDIIRLRRELLHERRQSERLSSELENPMNKKRWRRLEGKIPDKEDLMTKVAQLEERLADKQEQLLEKELILEEVLTLSERLRGQAAEGRGETLELAKRVNDYQSKIRNITRKMMATVSELSMYQASAMRLAGDKESLEVVLAEAKQRLAEGKAPTEEAERDWYRHERERMRDVMFKMNDAVRGTNGNNESMATDRSDAYSQRVSSGRKLSTADRRPTAYVPEDLGIPKPFGKWAPFKPSEQGSTMRHFRRPQPKEIEI